jgi:predicted Zn-dependent protease
MNSSDESSVKNAFDAWAAASGMTFKEVADSSQSDIRVGFGNFDTATTGVVGYTSAQASGGQFAPGAIVRVEDTSQDSLVVGSDGQQVYAGTSATLTQVLEHEIGHALGLALNSDQNSIMYYDLTSSNRSLDSTDIAGINSLYGPGAKAPTSSSISVNQLIQAMASFNTSSGATDIFSAVPPALLAHNISLASSVTVQ